MLSVGGMRTFFNKYGNGCALVLLLVFAVPLIVNFSSNQLGGRAARNASGPAAEDTVIAGINDQTVTEAEFREMSFRMQQSMGNAAPGRAYVEQQGRVMQRLIQLAVIRQEAQKRNARPLEADIDREIDKMKQALAQQQGKTKLSDSDWDAFLMNNRNMSPSDLREQTAKDLIPMALMNSLKAEQKVTDAEARSQYAQVRLTLVQVGYKDPTVPTLPGQKVSLLTEAEAQKRASDLLAKVKAGADIAQIAAANAPTKEEAKKAGDIGSIAEYAHQAAGQFSLNLQILYGKDLAEAVHKLEKGQTTEVVKLGGPQKAYGFARVVERKVETPKDFDAKKAVATLAEQRAGEKFTELLKSLVKSAKINIKDPDKKAYYDLEELQASQQPSMEDMMSGITPAMPDKAETEAKQALVNKEFEDMAKRHPDDVNAAIIVADNLKSDSKKMLEPGAQDRLIQMNESILKNTEDQDRRFDLANLYRDKKQNDKAKAQFDRIAKLLSYNPTYDADSMQAAATVHRKLEQGYRSINQSVEADKEKATFDELQQKITMERLKQAEEQRKNKTGTGITPNSSITLPPGGSATVPAGSSVPMTITPSPPSSSGASKEAPPVPASGAGVPAPSSSGLNLNLNGPGSGNSTTPTPPVTITPPSGASATPPSGGSTPAGTPKPGTKP